MKTRTVLVRMGPTRKPQMQNVMVRMQPPKEPRILNIAVTLISEGRAKRSVRAKAKK